MTAILPIAATALQTTVADTVVTVAARDGLQIAADVAVLVLVAALAVFFLVLLGLIRQIGKLTRTVRTLGRDALHKVDPLVERGNAVADNVEFVSAAIRADVERLNRTVKSLSDRLQQASDHMEKRIDEFNALMEVVQDEAEDIFIGTAATARGVKEGVRSLSAGRDVEDGDPSDASETHDEEEVFLTAPPDAGAAAEGGEERRADPVEG